MDATAAWAYRYLTPYSSALAVLALSVVLVFTIYYTLLELQWIAFLLGVLFAAVLSMVSHSVKAQWRLLRRSAQLRRSKELLAEESARSERSAQALKLADLRFYTIMDALPIMALFVDREERCLYHNRAFEAWCGRSASDTSGLPLRDLVDAGVYRDLESRGIGGPGGPETEYEAYWPRSGGGTQVAVKLLPYPVGAQTISGFYVFAAAIGMADAAGRGAASRAPGAPATASEAVYLDEMGQQITTEEDPREYLLRAIEEDRFILLEQTIEPLAASGGEAHLREILLRLREEDEGTLAPGGFFEVAEHYDLMPAIDRWVIRKLLKSCASMKNADRAWRIPLYCVNVSDATLRDRSFANHVRAQLQHWEISGSRLCFEIRHGALAESESGIGTLMDDLRPLGCRFTVDCFGSDRISFAPLSRLRFDYVKIDGSIICEILHKDSELAKTRAIVLACGKLGVRTIAQFVEDEATRARLKQVGVDFVQGYGIDKPGPLAVLAHTAAQV